MSSSTKLLLFLGIGFAIAVFIQVNWSAVSDLTMDEILGPEVPVSKQKYEIIGDRLAPLTELDEEGMKIQAEQGCIVCHE